MSKYHKGDRVADIYEKVPGTITKVCGGEHDRFYEVRFDDGIEDCMREDELRPTRRHPPASSDICISVAKLKKVLIRLSELDIITNTQAIVIINHIKKSV